MRLIRRGFRVVAAGAGAVAVGVAVNQVLNGGRWNLRWLVAAVVLAAFSEALDLWLGTHGSDHGHGTAAMPVLWPGLAGDDGMPLLLCEATPRDLGVHASRFDADGDSPYIRRQADDLLVAGLADHEKRVVLVEGPRLAGVTRTLAQAAQACLPDYLAAGFVDDPQVPLAAMITQAGKWAGDAQAKAAGAVVWLDGLSPDRFNELARVPLADLPPRVRVLATLDTGELEGLRIPEQLNILLDRHALRVQLGVITEQERRDMLTEDTYAALCPVLEENEDLFLGRLMMAWEPLRAALTRGGSEQAANRVALLRAVTDWYRVHLPRLLNHDILGHLYRAYRREMADVTADSPISAAGFSEALEWATAAPAADHPRLIDLQDVPRGHRYAPHPLLTVIADNPYEDVSWPVSDVLWSYADHYLRGDQRRDIGYSAIARGARHAAARLLSHTDATVDPQAYNQIAALFYEHADWASSRVWWQKAIATGHTDHAPKAMNHLGVLESNEGNPTQARHWYMQAIATGHTDQAPRAMVNLGLLEGNEGNPTQARHWYMQAIATGHTEASPKAMVNLGVLEDNGGNPTQARHWYMQAIATGHTDHTPRAMDHLGVLESKEGNLLQARHWYMQAIATGDTDHAPKAMYNLGLLEGNEGNLLQARHWYMQAIATGDTEASPRAMVNLGRLENAQGNLAQARHWYMQAIGTGHTDEASPRAMVNLGLLEGAQGNLAQARHWYMQAISINHPGITSEAQRELRALDRQEKDRERAEQFGQYGYLAYADPALMKQGGQAPEAPEPTAADDALRPTGDSSDDDDPE